MPRKVDQETRQEIVYMRALDYDKQEIAEKVGVSRNTVRKHLNEVRKDVEESDASKLRLATIILEASDAPSYISEQIVAVLTDAEDAVSENSGFINPKDLFGSALGILDDENDE